MQIIPNSAPLPSVPRMGRLKLCSMAASGRTHRSHRWLQALLALWIMVFPAGTAQAWPWGGEGAGGVEKPAEIVGATPPSGRLQEVSPPGAVQQLQLALNRHTPRLELISPVDGSLLKTGDVQLILRIEDWPLAEDPELGLGAHVALQIDDAPPLRFGHAENGRLQIRIPDLSPGSHRFTAYAAMPWGESVKSQGASLQWRLNLLKELPGTQPDQDAPWLAVVSPSDLGSGDPLLLDWLIWNAPLQNLREGDGRWRLRISVNGDSFLVDGQEALWLKAAGGASGSVQMELLDGLGEPIAPVFNNQLRATTSRSGTRPIWMQSKLSDDQMARLLGEALPEPEDEPETEPEPEQEVPEPAAQEQESGISESDESPVQGSLTQSPADDSDENDLTDSLQDPERGQVVDTASDTAPESGSGDESSVSADAEASDREQPDRTVAGSVPPKSEPASEPPRLRVTSSLGGSARELLNDDGTQR